MVSVTLDERFEKSIDRLKAMGLKFYIDAVKDTEAYIVIDLESVVKLIDSKITYPSRRTYMEGKYMIIKVWKGDEVNV
jgi:hypothetical protein